MQGGECAGTGDLQTWVVEAVLFRSATTPIKPQSTLFSETRLCAMLKRNDSEKEA